MYAQTDSIDLKKSVPVPEKDGKVVFSKVIETNKSISQEKLFKLLEKWAKNNYKGTDGKMRNMVALVDSVNGNIACLGDKLFVFEDAFWKKDETNMIYQLVLKVSDNQCEVVVEKIKFRLFTGDKSRPIVYLTAEEMISDEQAFNDDGEFKYNVGKFRVHTINFVNDLFDRVDVYLNGRKKMVKKVKVIEEEEVEEGVVE
jgi:hypothetical protein